MGTVHAKAQIPEAFTQDFGNEPERDMDRANVSLQGVRARVDKVNIDGLQRTKDDIVKKTISDLFEASDFEDVIVRAHQVRSKLDSMGCFKDIGVFIDVSSGPEATPEGLEVTFHVQELSKLVGGVNTVVGENEGSVVVGLKMPNCLGRGERLQAEYALGYRKSSNFSVGFSKPFPHKAFQPVLSSSVFQQNHEFPWSGFKQLDRGLLLDIGFKTSDTTRHNIQWEGIIRDVTVLSKTTSFKVRETCGPLLKSAIRHIVTIDRRDDPIFPTQGSLVQFTNELAGLGGSVAFLKNELFAQHNVSLTPELVLQATGQLGVLYDMFGTELTEHFYLGGPLSVRGFQQRGIGPHSDGSATGGKMYWASGLHLFAPLPFKSTQKGIGQLFRSHLFINGGFLASPESPPRSLEDALKDARASCGAGLALRLGSVARLELNYCLPLKIRPDDSDAPGLQFGIGVNFL